MADYAVRDLLTSAGWAAPKIGFYREASSDCILCKIVCHPGRERKADDEASDYQEGCDCEGQRDR